MALAFAERSSLYDTTNATTYTSSTTFTPASNSLMVAFVFASSTDTSASVPTSVSGNGVTYSQHANTLFVSGVVTGSVWAGIAASPTAGQVTASGWGTARTGVGISVFEITGADVSGTALAALVSVNTITGTGTSATVTMTGPVTAGDLNCGFFDHTASENIAAAGSNALGSTGNYATPARGGGSVFNNASYANLSASWVTSVAWRGMGVEIKVAAAAGGVTVKNLAALGVG